MSKPPQQPTAASLDCCCANPVECRGLSAVFRLMGDNRGGVVELPPNATDRATPGDDKIAYFLRLAYLRHLKVLPSDVSPNKSYFVAVHHFHPTVAADAILDPADERLWTVCRTIDEASSKALNMNLTKYDHAMDENGRATEQYFVVPNYPFDKVKNDAKKAFIKHKKAMMAQAQKQKKAAPKASAAPTPASAKEKAATPVPTPPPAPTKEDVKPAPAPAKEPAPPTPIPEVPVHAPVVQEKAPPVNAPEAAPAPIQAPVVAKSVAPPKPEAAAPSPTNTAAIASAAVATSAAAVSVAAVAAKKPEKRKDETPPSPPQQKKPAATKAAPATSQGASLGATVPSKAEEAIDSIPQGEETAPTEAASKTTTPNKPSARVSVTRSKKPWETKSVDEMKQQLASKTTAASVAAPVREENNVAGSEPPQKRKDPVTAESESVKPGANATIRSIPIESVAVESIAKAATSPDGKEPDEKKPQHSVTETQATDNAVSKSQEITPPTVAAVVTPSIKESTSAVDDSPPPMDVGPPVPGPLALGPDMAFDPAIMGNAMLGGMGAPSQPAPMTDINLDLSQDDSDGPPELLTADSLAADDNVGLGPAIDQHMNEIVDLDALAAAAFIPAPPVKREEPGPAATPAQPVKPPPAPEPAAVKAETAMPEETRRVGASAVAAAASDLLQGQSDDDSFLSLPNSAGSSSGLSGTTEVTMSSDALFMECSRDEDEIEDEEKEPAKPAEPVPPEESAPVRILDYVSFFSAKLRETEAYITGSDKQASQKDSEKTLSVDQHKQEPTTAAAARTAKSNRADKSADTVTPKKRREPAAKAAAGAASPRNPFDDEPSARKSPLSPSSTNPFADDNKVSRSTNPFDDDEPALVTASGSTDSGEVFFADDDGSVEEESETALASASALAKLKPLKDMTMIRMDREESLVFMSAIESKRRCWTMPELEIMRVEWTCHRALIRSMLRECKRIEALLADSIRAVDLYSGLLRAMYDDCLLEDDGTVALQPNRRTVLAKERAKLRRGNAPKPTVGNKKWTDPASSGILEPILESFLQVIDKVSESLPQLRAEVKSMKTLRSEIASRGEVLGNQGARIMYNMSCAEGQVQETWEELERMAGGAPGGEDQWLAEASYKNAVKQGMTLWSSQCQDLQQLCRDVVELDGQRRMRTKEILLAFLPRRRRLLLRMRELFAQQESRLEDDRAGRDKIDAEIDQALQSLSRQGLAHNKNRSTILNRSKVLNLNKFEADVSKVLKAPPKRDLYKGDLIRDVQVVEYKSSTGPPEWQKGLAVTTADCHLHVLAGEGLPEGSENGSTTPAIMKPSSFNGFVDSSPTNLKASFLPDETVRLGECTSVTIHAHQIELNMEDKTVPIQGLRKRKLLLRFTSPQISKEWKERHYNEMTLAKAAAEQPPVTPGRVSPILW